MATYTVESQFLTYAWGPKIVSLRVDPAGLTMNTGDVQQFTATAVWSDGTETDLTTDPDLHWYSDNYWPSPGFDTMSMSNDDPTRGQGTAMDVSTPGYVNADYWYNLWSETLTGGVTVDIVLPSGLDGLDALIISGNRNFDLAAWPTGFGAPTYLEAYPMRRDTSTVPWTSYLTTSGTNPNPPRTGYGTFTYNAGPHEVVVSSTTPRFWQGTYDQSPWTGPRYAMPNGSIDQWMTNGYQSAQYTGWDTDNANWQKAILPSYLYPFDGLEWTIGYDLNVPTFTANVNYYAQSLLQGPNFGNTLDMSFNNGFIVHFIGYGPFAEDMTTVTSINITTNFASTQPVAPWSLPFKALSATAILAWLPPHSQDPGFIEYWPLDFGGFSPEKQGLNFQFTTPTGTFTLISTWDAFTGV